MPRIELVGSLGVGKSTLCVSLAKAGCIPVYEDLKSNPFLTKCYEDPKTYRLPSQMWFALTKYHTIGEGTKEEHKGKVFVHDQATLNNNAYTNMLFRGAKEDATGWMLVNSFFEYTEKTLGKPDLLVYLKCSPEENLRRIKARGRKFEDKVEMKNLFEYYVELEELIPKYISRGHTLETIDVTDVSVAEYDDLAEDIVERYFT